MVSKIKILMVMLLKLKHITFTSEILRGEGVNLKLKVNTVPIVLKKSFTNKLYALGVLNF